MITNLFSASYLFNRSLGPFTSPVAWVFLVGLVLLMAGSWFFDKKIASKKDIFVKKASSRFFTFSWTMAWIGIVLWVFRQINVLYLGAPIFLLVWLIISLVWLGFILNYWFRIVPKRRQNLLEEKKKNKYLP